MLRPSQSYMSRDMTKPTKWLSVRPEKTHISLGILPAWTESSLCAKWVAKDPSFLRADSEDSDQTGRLPRLIWVFAGCTLILLVLSCCGSYCGHIQPSPSERGRRIEQNGNSPPSLHLLQEKHRRVVSLSKTLYSPKVLVNYPGSDGSIPTWLKNCWLGR